MTCTREQALDYVKEIREILLNLHKINRYDLKRREQIKERINFIRDELIEYRKVYSDD